jgi:phage terminase large subunit-like protein
MKRPLEYIKRILGSFSKKEIARLAYDWKIHARTNQLPPEGEWRQWLVMAGRGFGKTRTGAEWVRFLIETGRASRVALIAPTAADARDVMIMGESGLMNIAPPWMRPQWESSKRRLIWPNGGQAFAYSADEPDRLRGPQHDALWGDELAAWRYPAAWDMAMFGLRLGDNPRAVITTTPKPIKLLKDIMMLESTITVRGSTYDNQANLPKAFIAQIIKKYEGTRLGAQEIHAEILDEVPGALWQREMIESQRLQTRPKSFERIVVAVDPAVSSSSTSDETGIMVVAKDSAGEGYVLEDASDRMSPDEWAKIVVQLYHKYQADRVIAEVNQGGDLVEHMLRLHDRTISYRAVHASRGKVVRAEPIAALYEQERIHHIGGFSQLEDQMCSFTSKQERGSRSPDRVDALVWGLTELFLNDQEGFNVWGI